MTGTENFLKDMWVLRFLSDDLDFAPVRDGHQKIPELTSEFSSAVTLLQWVCDRRRSATPHFNLHIKETPSEIFIFLRR